MKTWLKRAAIAVSGTCLLATAGIYALTEARLHARYDVRVAPVVVRGDPETVARGEHVARAVAKCTVCHGADLAGRVIVESPLVGRLSAPNLTTEPLARRTDADLVRAMIHGVAPDGRPLVLMPAHEIGELGEDDVCAVIAYLRTVPRVERDVPPVRLGPVLRVKLATAGAELLSAEHIDHERPRPRAPVIEPSAAYGGYLAKAGGCFGCHRATLEGGPISGMPPSAPPAADIRPQTLARWSFADFDRALRQGIRPDGRRLAELMPWRATALMTDVEMRALYAFMKSGDAQGSNVVR